MICASPCVSYSATLDKNNEKVSQKDLEGGTSLREAYLNSSVFMTLCELFETKGFFQLKDKYQPSKNSLLTLGSTSNITISVSWSEDETDSEKTIKDYQQSGPLVLLQMESAIEDILNHLKWRLAPSDPASINQITLARTVGISDGDYEVISKVIFLPRGTLIKEELMDDVVRTFGRINPEQYQDLAKAIISKNLYELESSYGTPESDSPGIVITVFWETHNNGEEEKTIFDWDLKTSPFKLRQFEKSLKQIINSAEWENHQEDWTIVYTGAGITFSVLVVALIMILYYALKWKNSGEVESQQPMLMFKETSEAI